MDVRELSDLDLYTELGPMTTPGRYAALLADLPADIASVAAVVQGLLIHEHMAAGYGVTLPDAARASMHVRRVEQLLAQTLASDDRPLNVTRKPAGRLPVVCRHFAVLTTAILRSQGIPARARCGFGGYFGTEFFEDHWVCEYWHAGQHRWVLADTQIDCVQGGWFPIDFDLTDVPRDRFLVAGEAWTRCRSGTAEPSKFGLSRAGQAGDWWIAGNLMRDAAALLNLELLPWDCWGAMPAPDEPISSDTIALFDRLAALTSSPEGSVIELRELCQDKRLGVPATVRNAIRGTDDAIVTAT